MTIFAVGHALVSDNAKLIQVKLKINLLNYYSIFYFVFYLFYKVF
jgi:hypothetical protein